MRILSRVVTVIGLCIGAFAATGLRSYEKTGEFLGLDVIVLQIDLLIGIFMLALGLAMILCVMAQERVIEKAARRDADIAEGQPPREDIPLCYTCLTPAKPHQHFCMNCWTPLTSHAEIDPLGQIYATGDMYWKLTRGSSGPIAMIGLFLLVVPLLIGLPFVIISIVSESVSDMSGSRLSELFSLDGIIMALAGLLVLATEIVYALIFIKAIRNYRRRRKREKSCYEFREEKDVESAPGSSGDYKHPPSGPTEFRETRDK